MRSYDSLTLGDDRYKGSALNMYDWRKTMNRLLMGVALISAGLGVGASTGRAELSKGHRILIQRGLQTQGMVTANDVFNLATYQNANYSAINWLWDSNVTLHGAAPGFPWVRWVGDENQMPGAPGPTAAESPYVSQLVALQLGDEWHLNYPAVRDRAVNWFSAVRDQWPQAILYMNSYGGQVNDAALGDFITRARPDMLSFDTYPYRNDYVTHQPNAPAYGSPTSWYSELRRYRVHALNAGIPVAIYRQTFRAIQDYDQTEYRAPSASEQNLNTFGALAFGVTTFIDFTYNTGASTLFTSPGGDSHPTPAYGQQAEINLRARNLGKSLVHLTALNNRPNGADHTTDVMFLRGKHETGPGAFAFNPLPIGFIRDPQATAQEDYSDWVSDRNDPYLRGWVVANLGTKNSGLRGDVTISWFKPLDSTMDNPSDVDDQLYFMVVNALTGPDGTAADYRQEIKLNFLAAPATTSLQRLNSLTGEVEVIPLPVVNTRRQLTIQLDGGEGQLFKFNTGDPFIGVQPSADFDVDGDVDGADFMRWQRGFGDMGSAAHGHGDANRDLNVDAIDFNLWKSRFGGAPGLTSVPEPAASVLFLVGGLRALLIEVLRRSPTRAPAHRRELLA